jgi:hypothetical protein
LLAVAVVAGALVWRVPTRIRCSPAPTARPLR